ncbi:MAG: hypothetical protein WCJ84_02865, partial [Candidatus Peregrinibacteria bacterium]
VRSLLFPLLHFELKLRNRHENGQYPNGVLGIDARTVDRGNPIETARFVHHLLHAALFTIDPDHQNFQSVLFTALPEHLAANALQKNREKGGRKPEKRALKDLLGEKGVGLSNLLVAYLDSLQGPAAALYNEMAGPVLGVHQMHGPGVSNLNEQNVILGVTPKKEKHHLQEPATQWMISFLEGMGYDKKNIATMSVEKHDKLMADVQFLSHTLFLVLASAVKKQMGTANYSSENIPEWVNEALLMAQRILSGKDHVYRNIAVNNPHNPELLSKLIEKVGSTSGSDNIESFAFSLFRAGEEAIAEYLAESQIKEKESRFGETPVSATRDGIIKMLRSKNIIPVVAHTQDTALVRALAEYEGVMNDPKAYDALFASLQSFFPERNIPESNPVIAKYRGKK